MYTNDRRELREVAITILALVGSLRAASINRQIAELARAVATDGVTVTLFEGLGDLPFYNEEIDDAMNADAPPLAPVAALRAAAADADAALVVTPEYNGSIPAVVKNAIDWLSRPFGDGALKGKPLAVIGGSFGRYGGVWAHDETRKSFGIAGARVVESIKLSVPFTTLEGRAPAEDAELSANVRDVVGKLAAEAG
ncbi:MULTISPECIES: NAD(P)H-dependent oxidoreductase [Mycobacterium]|uniref:NAD(P)H-dependent oxidoreductase n=1 Tax=Mycobacterium TaxID=1763 RepID=UPI001CD9B44F|nr:MULTISPECIES: NAD(P)H-dependent oxidoreductase [Mycobacterium]MCA2240809.1 NAD(P)H-dependent oxidoreductase [Mycobacterium sp. WUMAC-067]MCA2313219.1 NAD(P)H-dependent oxidoreductase [Mycobacterium sp. WUMAC-025]MEE3750473.1 NAD(P)H-dependent oxidoreductase [Mycobacterium intracellulare]